MMSAASLADEFHRDGVAIITQALASDDIERLRRQALALRQQAEHRHARELRIAPGFREQAQADRAGVGAWSWGITNITRETLFDPLIVNAMAHPAIQRAIEALIEQPRTWGLKMLWAPRACTYSLPWHRDIDDSLEPLLPFKPQAQDHLQFNIALADDQSFRVVPGTHRRALHAHERAAWRANPRGSIPGERHCPLQAGDVLLMDAHALHRGEVSAGSPRLTLHYSVQAQWVPLRPWLATSAWAWLTSDALANALDPAIRPWFHHLRTARLDTSHQYSYLRDQALAAGWTPPPGWTLPPQPGLDALM